MSLLSEVVARQRLQEAEPELSEDGIIVPPVPTTVHETGINRDLLLKLVAKVFQVHGSLAPSQVAREIKLPVTIVNELLKELQKLQYIESKGLVENDMRSELRYMLGGQGVHYAAMAMAQSQYVGPAPVSLEAWISQIRAQTISVDHVSREALKKALGHLVLPENITDFLGPAVNSAKSVLLYGKPGNGKTSIAEAMGRAFSQRIFIPHCFEVGSQIINLFDPTLHNVVEESRPSATSSRPPFDQRWQLCRRPFVLTGGELTLDMLDLSYNEVSRYYEAPIHLKAIGGVFVIDDFGRQRTDPQAVLNRWIVPLERRYDFLTLHTGKKFSVPFDQLAVFSTNIEPTDLADAGALRRLYYKINIPVPKAADYRRIFIELAERMELPFDNQAFNRFFEKHYGPGKMATAGHHPKYIIDFIISVCRFKDEPLHMSEELLEAGLLNLEVG